jgi:fluoroacetyl-CoA thioesterase
MEHMIHDVTDDDTALALGSGDVPVLGTPRMIAWREAATVAAAAPHLEPGTTTVGTAVRVQHRRPTPVGGRMEVTAEVQASEEGRMTFAVQAVDGDGKVAGTGEIDRVIVRRDGFGS